VYCLSVCLSVRIVGYMQ